MPKQALLCVFALLVSQAAQAQYREHTIYLSGKVVLEDGGVPSDLVQIERVCGAQTLPGGFTDSKGKFTVRVGADLGAQLQDADNAGTDFRGRRLRDPNNEGGLTGRTESMGVVRNAGTVDLFGCDLRARLAGYRSNTIALGRRSVFDKPDVGTLVLTPYEGITGALVSATTLAAPKAAEKLYQRAQKEWRKKKPIPSKAAKDLDQAVEIYPTYAAAWDLLGKTRLSLQDEAGALAAYSKAIEADGMYLRPYMPLIKLNVRSGQWLRAAMLSGNLLGLHPNSLEARFYSALAGYQLEHYDEAQDVLAPLLADETGGKQFPLARHLEGLIHSKRGEFKAAAKAYRAFLELDSTSPTSQQVSAQLKEWEVLGVIAAAK